MRFYQQLTKVKEPTDARRAGYVIKRCIAVFDWAGRASNYFRGLVCCNFSPKLKRVG